MVLLFCPIPPMIKRQTVAACKGRLGRRKDSAVRTLVAETLVLAKTHGYVEKIENELEEELAREIREPPAQIIDRWRRKGEKIFKSKYMLLTVVFLCVTDCALVLGELILDLHKVKVTLDDTDKFTKTTGLFISNLEQKYPNLQTRSPSSVFTMLLNASIYWDDGGSDSNGTGNSSVACVPLTCTGYPVNDISNLNISSIPVIHKQLYQEHIRDLYILGKIAHAFHYSSIAIVGILLIETCMKALCSGKNFLHRKIEVFDAFIVLVSFVVDFAFLVFIPNIDTKEFVFILAILLPWRVIRVVNSLVVAVKDHEHFRLKLVYSRKKKIQGNLREAECMMIRYRSQCTTLQRLCIMEGIDEWKIDHCLSNDDSKPPPWVAQKTATPVKKKFKFKFDDNIFTAHHRGPRCSLPSLELHGLKFSNGSASKPRSSLPSIALQSLKNTINRNLPSRRASMATVDMYNPRLFNGDLKRKKIASDDLQMMREDTIMESHDSAVNSSSASESEDKEVFQRGSLSDSIGSAQTGSDSARTYSRRIRRLRSESTDSEREMPRVKTLEDDTRRHSDTTFQERVRQRGLSCQDDTHSFMDERGKTFTVSKRQRSVSSDTGSDKTIQTTAAELTEDVGTAPEIKSNANSESELNVDLNSGENNWRIDGHNDVLGNSSRECPGNIYGTRANTEPVNLAGMSAGTYARNAICKRANTDPGTLSDTAESSGMDGMFGAEASATTSGSLLLSEVSCDAISDSIINTDNNELFDSGIRSNENTPENTTVSVCDKFSEQNDDNRGTAQQLEPSDSTVIDIENAVSPETVTSEHEDRKS